MRASKVCPVCSTTEKTEDGRCKRCRNNRSNRVRLTKEPQLTMLRMARKRSKRNGIPCSIHLADITVPQFCPTLDKMRPELGYVVGNIQVISNKANLIKSNATIDDLQAVLVYMQLNRLTPGD